MATLRHNVKRTWDAYVQAYPKDRGEPEWKDYIDAVQEYADHFDLTFIEAHQELIRDLNLKRPEDDDE